MAEIDYIKLTRQQKLAVFLICLGPDAAAELLKQFDDSEAEGLCRAMSTFTVINEQVVRQALDEFFKIISSSAGSVMGGLSYAQRALGIAKGDHKASSILGRVGPAGSSDDVLKEISEMEGGQIFNLVKQEQPQTISFILSYLNPTKSAEVFALLGPELREEVVERLGTLESTSADLAGKIVRSIGRHFDNNARPALLARGGVRVVAELLNTLNKEMSKSLLARVEERNSLLGAAIRKSMFSFEDLTRLSASDLQRVLREVDTGNLAIAMKAASEPLREKIYAGLSKRAAEGLREEIDLLGPVKRKDVEGAQDGIIQAVRKLEEEGQVSLDNEAQALVS